MLLLLTLLILPLYLKLLAGSPCRCPHDPTLPLPVPLDTPLTRKSSRLHSPSSHASTAALSSACVPPDDEKDAVRGEDFSSSSGHISEGINPPRRTAHTRMHPICYATVSHAILTVESQLEARISAGVSTPAHETPTSSATLISVPPITTTVYSETRAKILFGCFLCHLANKSSTTQIGTLNPITIESAYSCL